MGVHTPGVPAPGAVYTNCATDAPSFARACRVAAATLSPTLMPGLASVRVLDARDAARLRSSAACCDGNSVTRTRCAAAIAAASADAPDGLRLLARYRSYFLVIVLTASWTATWTMVMLR